MRHRIPGARGNDRIEERSIPEVRSVCGIDPSDDDDALFPEDACEPTGRIGVIQREPGVCDIGPEDREDERWDAPLPFPLDASSSEVAVQDGLIRPHEAGCKVRPDKSDPDALRSSFAARRHGHGTMPPTLKNLWGDRLGRSGPKGFRPLSTPDSCTPMAD